jgi:hypothetical protein
MRAILALTTSFIMIATMRIGGFCDTTYTYLLYSDSFTKADVDKIKDYGYKKDKAKVPLHITKEFQPPNTNYIIIKVTPSKESEDDDLKDLKFQGKALLLQKSTYVEEYNPQLGGIERRVDVELVDVPPEDTRRDWTKPYETIEEIRKKMRGE